MHIAALYYFPTFLYILCTFCFLMHFLMSWINILRASKKKTLCSNQFKSNQIKYVFAIVMNPGLYEIHMPRKEQILNIRNITPYNIPSQQQFANSSPLILTKV